MTSGRNRTKTYVLILENALSRILVEWLPTWSWHQIRQPHIREYEASEYEA